MADRAPSVENLTSATPAATYTYLFSVDVFRGMKTVRTSGNAFGWRYFRDSPNTGPVAGSFIHAGCQGINPWDLVRPFFRFILGAAIPYAREARLGLRRRNGYRMSCGGGLPWAIRILPLFAAMAGGRPSTGPGVCYGLWRRRIF